MDVRTQVGKITNFSGAAIGWAGKAAILFILVAVLGFTQNLYGIDVHLSAKAPMVRVEVVVFDSMPRVSWYKFVNFINSLMHSSHSNDQACRATPPAHQVG